MLALLLASAAALQLRPANSSRPVNASLHATNESSPLRVLDTAVAKPMLWWHVHKAAGTYMCEKAQLYRRVINPNHNCNWARSDRYVHADQRALLAVSCQERAAAFAAQYATWGAVEREVWPEDLGCPQFAYGTMLREPLGLMRSNHNFYNMQGQRAPGQKVVPMHLAMQKLRKAASVKHTTFPAPALGAGLTRIFDNLQVRYFSGAWDAPFGTLTRQHLETAKQRLSAFDVLAVVEELKTDRLFSALGWPKQWTQEKPNTTPDYSREEVPSKDRPFVKELNALDFELYAFVKHRTSVGHRDWQSLSTWA